MPIVELPHEASASPAAFQQDAAPAPAGDARHAAPPPRCLGRIVVPSSRADGSGLSFPVMKEDIIIGR